MSYLKEHVETSLLSADLWHSNIPNIADGNDFVGQPLRISGMSGRNQRHFFNNLCSMEDARYLEIGLHSGSTFCSAMYGNKMKKCLGIDNWSQFITNRDSKGAIRRSHRLFKNNFKKFKGENCASFMEANCWEVNPLDLGNFNIYFYDGEHQYESQFKGLDYFLPCLDKEFVFVVDDWNDNANYGVKEGTLDAISKNNLKTIYKKEIFTEMGNRPSKGGWRSKWHNGIGIFVLSKDV